MPTVLLTLVMACCYLGLWVRLLGNGERLAARFGWHDSSCKTEAGIFADYADGWPYWIATNRCFHELIFDNQITWRKIVGRSPDISMKLPVGIITTDEFTCEPWGLVVCNRSDYPDWPFKIAWERDICGFVFGEKYNLTRRCNPVMFVFKYWKIPHWAFAIPLTLLSAYLLLSKPRKKPAPKAPAETTSEKMA